MQSTSRVRPWSFECLVEWLKIREEAGHKFPNDVQEFVAELDHSALLQRLCTGKQPLPDAPPLSFGYPWYDLIEKGWAKPGEVLVCDQVTNDTLGHPAVVINQSVWKIVEQAGDQDFVLTYGDGKSKYRLHRADETWRLEKSAR